MQEEPPPPERPTPVETEAPERRGWRRHLRVRPGFPATVALAAFAAWFLFVRMPGESHRGPLPPAPELGPLAAELRGHVEALAGEIGPRSLDDPPGMRAAVAWLETTFRGLGYEPRLQAVPQGARQAYNVEVELPGTTRADEIVIVGAHYDTTVGLPGANDNGSGTAAVLALARAFRDARPARTLRFVAFANEEPPWFQGESMGSLVYARAARERDENVVAMWSLETLGYFDDAPGSQRYPVAALRFFYPDRGDFVAFVSNFASRDLLRRTLADFRELEPFPTEGAALPGYVAGVGWSDHWSFWQVGYPALMVTDTAPFRYPHYHEVTDTPEKLDYDRLARVVRGLEATLWRTVDPQVD